MQSFKSFKSDLIADTALQQQFKTDPVQAVKDYKSDGPLPDTWIYRLVVGALGLSILLVIGAVVILTANTANPDKNVPTVLTAIASGAIGALAGLLAPSPSADKN
jgi:hypothetical protein